MICSRAGDLGHSFLHVDAQTLPKLLVETTIGARHLTPVAEVVGRSPAPRYAENGSAVTSGTGFSDRGRITCRAANILVKKGK